MFSISNKNYRLLTGFAIMIIGLSALLRITLLFISLENLDLTFTGVLRIFGFGLLFDAGVATFFILPYAAYLLFLPLRWSGSLFNRIVTYVFFFVTTLVLMFSFFAEFTFWLEFESRFNFIAVDYLVYTYEVVQNINESYPLPVLITCMLSVTGIVTWGFAAAGMFRAAFRGNAPFFRRAGVFVVLLGLATVYALFIGNGLAEKGRNRYHDELAKAGIYSFFSAFKNNELNYEQFYRLIGDQEAFAITRAGMKEKNSEYLQNGSSIRRRIRAGGTEIHPNVILVTIESLSADFMERFGNSRHITPVLDSLARKNLVFDQMYATGTRTVRGMEALSLAVPPTPGSSIVRRPENGNLSTVGAIFRAKGYSASFLYGGDGYFDNMNQFFGSNGYNIIDKGRGLVFRDRFAASRTEIPDSLVHFRNAWGICDEDLYAAVIRDAGRKFREGKPFFDFVMTTSNHRPFTYPEGKVNYPSGSGREGAVQYTDYAIGQFLKAAQKEPWYRNTVIIFVADHCASSAGKNEIDIARYHIPAVVCNLPGGYCDSIPQVCSQIDLFPTLFGLLRWSYNSNLYGMDVRQPGYISRAFIGTYQKLAYLKNDSLVILSPQQRVETMLYSPASNSQTPAAENKKIAREAIAYYQTAYYLFKHGGLRLN
ncbi:LTA synthase family protein [Chitinophaga sp. GCM10012297]|uniref:Sulfatase-like hydrolase/transferase n=1 Tax=Chitinophaga chungangae TaxID=2821488 RepID=A0ABS3Y9Z4_9BACT|nr:alkaline phosphatase family protein [Chitinophaga chungangae]MBO9151497.1 sulfatase-like hydrolase/transferase [Chitinophaga chungangae]